MTDMTAALRALRRLALATSQAELDDARIEAIDILSSAGWDHSARVVTEILGTRITCACEQSTTT